MITISFVNYWHGFDYTSRSNYFIQFIESNMDAARIVPTHECPDILFASCFGDVNVVRNIRAKVKVFFYGENVYRFPPYDDVSILQSVFDIILGFKYTNKPEKIFRFPLWLLYYPFYNMTDTENNVLTFLEKQHEQNKRFPKTEFASLIATHDKWGQRTILLKEMQKYGHVLCPSLFHRNCNRIGQDVSSKIEFMKKCIYNICPENSTYEGYHTEKIFQALESGSIPIYWGVSEPEKEILHRNKYCFIENIHDPTEVYFKIKYAMENPTYYIENTLFNTDAPRVVHAYYADFINELNRLLGR